VLDLICMRFHFVVFITLMEIFCWFLGGLWLRGVSLLLGWMIVLVAWRSSHMCLPCCHPSVAPMDGCGAYYLIMMWFGIYAYLGYG
jgi:hypothetical protein